MKKQYLFLLPLLFSGFTHLWNPVGFPDIFFALMLSALGNKNSSKEHIQFVLTGMITFLFVKALSNRSQSGETQMINE